MALLPNAQESTSLPLRRHLETQRYDQFAARLDGMVPMAHNAPFDARMLVTGVDHITPPGAPNDGAFFGFVDTIVLAKQLVDVPSCKLYSLLELVGLANPNAHTAIADATATGVLFNKLLEGKATHAQYSQLP